MTSEQIVDARLRYLTDLAIFVAQDIRSAQRAGELLVSAEPDLKDTGIALSHRLEVYAEDFLQEVYALNHPSLRVDITTAEGTSEQTTRTTRITNFSLPERLPFQERWMPD